MGNHNTKARFEGSVAITAVGGTVPIINSQEAAKKKEESVTRS